MKIAITGHRPDKLNNEWDGVRKCSDFIRSHLQEVIDKLKPNYLISGMALGVDMIWAELSIKNNIPFVAAIPCKQQYSKWPQKSKEKWFNITDYKLCSKFYVSTESYRPDLMQKRNRWMVDNCDILVAVWNKTNGGTKNCIDYAISTKKEIIYINPNARRS